MIYYVHMKILLLTDIKNIGKKGSICEVADGLAINKLIPEKKATQATTKTVKTAQSLSHQSENSRQLTEQKKMLALKHITDFGIVNLTTAADAHGSLYKHITVSDIITQLQIMFPSPSYHMSEITPRDVVLPTAIKSIGKSHCMILGNHIPIVIHKK